MGIVFALGREVSTAKSEVCMVKAVAEQQEVARAWTRLVTGLRREMSGKE